MLMRLLKENKQNSQVDFVSGNDLPLPGINLDELRKVTTLITRSISGSSLRSTLTFHNQITLGIHFFPLSKKSFADLILCSIASLNFSLLCFFIAGSIISDLRALMSVSAEL